MDGCILDEKLKSRVPNYAIDVFFESLAKDQKKKAVGIVLSGTGTDGTKGIAAIKKARWNCDCTGSPDRNI